MKKIITAFIFCFLFGECFSQAGEWVWIKGDSIWNQLGNFGVQGVSSPTNNPPSLYESSEWTDLNGNFWLFSGYIVISGNAESYGDLWKYDHTSNEWTWMKGSGIINAPGSYGVQGIPSPTNRPPSRVYGPASWVDNQGNLWMFGGFYGGSFNDLWKYDISSNEWTWIKGDSTGNSPGVFGTQGVPSPANNPPGRSEIPSAWTDTSGYFWLYGGWDGGKSYNDLWRYDISTNEWTWMKGDTTINSPGVYGAIGVESPANVPRDMCVHCRWKDNNGMLWMFGGYDFNSGNSYADLWRFNPLTNSYAFMGSNLGSAYGTKCVVSSLNFPGARFENRAAWKDQHGDFWSFGGIDSNIHILNDLWKYCITTNQWVWVSGNNTVNSHGFWGTMGVSNPLNMPMALCGSVGWTDNNGHFYLFGGIGNNGGKVYNSLWKYTIDTTCGVCPTSTGIQENSLTNELLVFPNPTNSSFTISFLQRSPFGQSSEKQSIELRIYNTLGKQVYFSKEEIAGGKFEKEINVERFSNGIYFLQLKTEDGNINRKVIINH